MRGDAFDQIEVAVLVALDQAIGETVVAAHDVTTRGLRRRSGRLRASVRASAGAPIRREPGPPHIAQRPSEIQRVAREIRPGVDGHVTITAPYGPRVGGEDALRRAAEIAGETFAGGGRRGR